MDVCMFNSSITSDPSGLTLVDVMRRARDLTIERNLTIWCTIKYENKNELSKKERGETGIYTLCERQSVCVYEEKRVYFLLSQSLCRYYKCEEGKGTAF